MQIRTAATRHPDFGFHGRQTCLNGHVITSYLGKPFGEVRRQTHCSRCGEKTIEACPSCNEPQRGFPLSGTRADNAEPQAYCHKCGKPYPWTERRTQAALEMIQEEDHLKDSDKALLSASLSELISDTPKTALAATRFKRIVSGAGATFRAAMYKFVVDVASETAKKIIEGE